jgi:predicted nucleotidyltransferase
VGARIDVDRKRVAALCRRWRIRELALFGSVLRQDFGTDSDVDVLVEFEPGQTPGISLVTKPGLRNPFFRHEILRTREVLYAA